MASLLDVNVLLTLMHSQHQHTKVAWSWAEDQALAGSILICRVCQMGAFRLLTNPKVMGPYLVSSESLWTGWGRLLTDDRFIQVPEPLTLESSWRKLTCEAQSKPSIDTDTYLAAFAMAGNYTLVTFDRGFLKYAGLKTKILA